VALVTLANAGRGSIEQTLSVYGEVDRGVGQRVLAAPIEATVARIEAPAGSTVAAGQVIARLRPSPSSQAQLQTAATDATAADDGLARAQRLRADGLASDAEVETARARNAAASAQLAALRAGNAQLLMRAPVAGYVESIAVSIGDQVQPGTVIATLSRAGATIARFGIDPALLRGLSASAPVELVPGDGAAAFRVPASGLSPVVDAGTRLATLLVAVPADKHLAAGTPLSARIVVRTSADAVTVPHAALLDDGGQAYVFVVSAEIAHRHDVQIGARDARSVAILAGVKPGDQVVTAGGTALEDGMQVRTQ
jgi:RND family efflux transporter MFP subunit